MSDIDEPKKSKKSSKKEDEEDKQKKEEESDSDNEKSNKKDKSDGEKKDKKKKKDKKAESESESEDDGDKKKKGKKSRKNKSDDPCLELERFYCREAKDESKQFFSSCILHWIEKYRKIAAASEAGNCDPEEFATYAVAKAKYEGNKTKRKYASLATVNAEVAEIVTWLTARLMYEFQQFEGNLKEKDIGDAPDTEKLTSDAAKAAGAGSLLAFSIQILEKNGMFPLKGDDTGYSTKDLDLMAFYKDLYKNCKKEFSKSKFIAEAAAHLVIRFIYLLAKPIAEFRWYNKISVNASTVAWAITVVSPGIEGAIQWREAINAHMAPLRDEAEKKKKKKTKKDSKEKKSSKKSSKKKKKKDDSDEEEENSADDAESDDE